MTPPDISQELLLKFEQGRCTEKEYKEVVCWLQAAEGTEAHANFMQKNWQQPRKAVPETDYQQLFVKINNAIQSRTVVRHSSWHRQALRIAAVFLGILLCGVAYQYLKPAPLRQISTAYGEIKHIRLPDNSTVTLNANSQLAFSEKWNQTDREVWLEGEAFFSVQHLNNHQKFIVHTKKKLAIEVLGTKFNVLARPGSTQVVLSSGEIRLDIPQVKSVTMKPGELVQFKDKPADYTKMHVDPAAYAAWKANKLVLNNTSLRQIITRIQDTYGVTVQVSDPALLTLTGSGTIPAESLETLLQVLSAIFELKVNRSPAGILLSPNTNVFN